MATTIAPAPVLNKIKDKDECLSTPLCIEYDRLVILRVDDSLIRFVFGSGMAKKDFEKAVIGLKPGDTIQYGGSSILVEDVRPVVNFGKKKSKSNVPTSSDSSLEETLKDKEAVEDKKEDEGGNTESWRQEMEDLRDDANHAVRICGAAVKQGEAGKPAKEVWKAVGWYRRALGICRKYDAGKEEEARLLTNLIVVLGLLGKWGDCRMLCWEAIDGEMASKKVWYWLAKTEKVNGVMEEAIRFLEKALELDPTDAGLKKELELWKKTRNTEVLRGRKEFAEVYNSMLDSPIYRT